MRKVQPQIHFLKLPQNIHFGHTQAAPSPIS
jgi:hypothetical protein